MDVPCQQPFYAYAAPPAPAASSQGFYVIGLLLFIAFCLWFFAPSFRSRSRGADTVEIVDVYGAAAQQGNPGAQTHPQAAAHGAHEGGGGVPQRPFNQPHGSLPAAATAAPGKTGCTNPQAAQPMQPTWGATRAESNSWGAAVPTGNAQSPRVPASLFSSSATGSPIDDTTYAASPETAQYYETFKPVSLESTMPMGWRSPGASAKCGDAEDELYGEFSRYAISPNQMKRAENMKSVLRLSELSREGLSRTLGQRSLLRDFVTPLGPQPIGDNAMLFNDSSVRQNYIASALGRFPEVSQSC